MSDTTDTDIDTDTESDADEWREARKKPVTIEYRNVTEREEIHTREGTIVAEPGDYIIRGVEGEVYPIDADIFEKTYDRLHDTDS